MSVDIERRARYGETGCDKAISVDGGVLCVMNEGNKRVLVAELANTNTNIHL